jgi:single-strand DNA-binding protein
MSRDGLQVTVVGWAASTPREVVGEGVAFTSFRVATTPRWYDSRQGTWTDGRTEWITVKAFRDAAFNIAASVHKGQPVIVQGRLRTEEWTGENGPRTTLVLDAAAVGHDLTRGTAKFARRVNVSGGEGVSSTSSDGTVDGPWSTEPRAGAPDEDQGDGVDDETSAAGGADVDQDRGGSSPDHEDEAAALTP